MQVEAERKADTGLSAVSLVLASLPTDTPCSNESFFDIGQHLPSKYAKDLKIRTTRIAPFCLDVTNAEVTMRGVEQRRGGGH